MTALTVSLPAPSTTPAAPVAASPTTRAWTPGARATARLAVRVALMLLAAIAVIAITVRVVAAGRAREWLGFPFTGVPATIEEAAQIFAHNAGAMLGASGLLLIAQLAARRPHAPATAQRWIRAGGELLLAGVIAANLAVVGAALGGYGTRMVRAVLPHGPVELAAFALAIALYLQGRHRAIAGRHLIATGAASLALLAAAALLEALVVV